jgi:hypothetical protein
MGCFLSSGLHKNPVNPGRIGNNWALWLMVGLLLVGAALVWHDLGTREVLGRDENATITKLDQPNPQAVLEATYMKVVHAAGCAFAGVRLFPGAGHQNEPAQLLGGLCRHRHPELLQPL